MCGIFGIISKNDKTFSDIISKTINQQKIQIMNHLIFQNEHPDLTGEFIDEKCYFLTTHSNNEFDNNIEQPYQSNGIVLMFNGNIYNSPEIRNYLNNRGYNFKTL